TEGTAPPVQPKIEFAGDPAEVVRDEHGIARGGIRLPQVAVPLATNTAIPLADDIFAYLRGSCHSFGTQTLRALYRDKASFITKFTDAAQRAVAVGVLRPRDVTRLVAEAQESWRD